MPPALLTLKKCETENKRAIRDFLPLTIAVSKMRFASVYRNFREARDFEEFLGGLSGEDEPRPVGAGRK
jgi:transcriptional regulator NrdR family protein